MAVGIAHRIGFVYTTIEYSNNRTAAAAGKKVDPIELSNQVYWYSKLLEKWIIGLQFHIWITPFMCPEHTCI